MNPRSQLRHMLIDVDFFSNPKIRALGRQYGAIGKLTVIEIYCAMSRATNAIIDEDAFLVIAEDNGIEESLEFLKYCLDKKLIIKDGDGYSNSVVIADQESYAKSLERKSKDSERKRKGIPSEFRRNADTDTDTDIDLNNIKNSPPELPIEIDGRKQCKNGKFVYLSELEKELLISNYASEGIEKPVISEAIFILSEHIEKNINAPNGEEYLRKGQQKAFEMLSKSWVKDEARKKQKNKTDLETSQKRADYRRSVNATEGRTRYNNSPPKGSQVADLIQNLSKQKAIA